MARIRLPHNFIPREYQLPLFRAMDSGYKRAVVVWHRRAGKDKTLVNLVAKKAFERVGTYNYYFPTYSQGKKILWDGMDRDGFKFRDHFPDALVKATHQQDLKITLINGSIVQLVGTDNVDSLVGTNVIGAVFSEYSLQDPRAWDLVRPILRENGGWAVFNFTPRGKNHAFDLYEMARHNPDWFVQRLTIEDTGVLSRADMDAERMAGMSEDMIQQEFYCSFEAAATGAYYARQMEQAEQEGRIGRVPHDPALGVDTFWDLGMADSMAIWFTQVCGHEVRVIDYYECSGEGFAHYAKELQTRSYNYRNHWAPHDIAVREIGTGKSRQEMAKSMGINFRTVPNLPVMDGIEASRSMMAHCYFDDAKCKLGIRALKNYHRAWNEHRKEFLPHPVHDWSSHAADAFRYLSVALDTRAPLVLPKRRRSGSWMSS